MRRKYRYERNFGTRSSRSRDHVSEYHVISSPSRLTVKLMRHLKCGPEQDYNTADFFQNSYFMEVWEGGSKRFVILYDQNRSSMRSRSDNAQPLAAMLRSVSRIGSGAKDAVYSAYAGGGLESLYKLSMKEIDSRLRSSATLVVLDLNLFSFNTYGGGG